MKSTTVYVLDLFSAGREVARGDGFGRGFLIGYRLPERSGVTVRPRRGGRSGRKQERLAERCVLNLEPSIVTLAWRDDFPRRIRSTCHPTMPLEPSNEDDSS